MAMGPMLTIKSITYMTTSIELRGFFKKYCYVNKKFKFFLFKFLLSKGLIKVLGLVR
jgi:hypothetical protein